MGEIAEGVAQEGSPGRDAQRHKIRNFLAFLNDASKLCRVNDDAE